MFLVLICSCFQIPDVIVGSYSFFTRLIAIDRMSGRTDETVSKADALPSRGDWGPKPNTQKTHNRDQDGSAKKKTKAGEGTGRE